MLNTCRQDYNGSLRDSFINYSLILNMKKTIKKKYMEACKMEKEKVVSPIYGEKIQKDVMVDQVDLLDDTNEDSPIIAVTYDLKTFGMDYCVQYVYVSNGKSYKRILTQKGCSKFTENLPGGKI